MTFFDLDGNLKLTRHTKEFKDTLGMVAKIRDVKAFNELMQETNICFPTNTFEYPISGDALANIKAL